jgi:hypothetical protein
MMVPVASGGSSNNAVVIYWVYSDFVDRLVVGSGGESRLTVFELHG